MKQSVADEMKKFGSHRNDSDTENDCWYIRTKEQIRYCPECGKKTQRTDRKVTTEIVCPEHGEIIV